MSVLTMRQPYLPTGFRYEPYKIPAPARNFIPVPSSPPAVGLPAFNYDFYPYKSDTAKSQPAAVVSQPSTSQTISFSIDSILGLDKNKPDCKSDLDNFGNFTNYGVQQPASYYFSIPPKFPTVSFDSNPAYQFIHKPALEINAVKTCVSDSDERNSPVTPLSSECPISPAENLHFTYEVGKQKRSRTIFTAYQMARLEAEFEKTQYMVGEARVHLASVLNLSANQVKIWFQNRRIKWRKQNHESEKSKNLKTRGL